MGMSSASAAQFECSYEPENDFGACSHTVHCSCWLSTRLGYMFPPQKTSSRKLLECLVGCFCSECIVGVRI